MMQVTRCRSASSFCSKAACVGTLSTPRRASNASLQRSRQNSGASSLASPARDASRRPSVSLEIPGHRGRKMSVSSNGKPTQIGPGSLADLIQREMRGTTPSPTGSYTSYSPGDDVYFSVGSATTRPRSSSYRSVQSATSHTSRVSSTKDKDRISKSGISKFPDLPVVEVKPPSVKSKDSSSTTSSERRQRARGLSDLSAASNYSCASQNSVMTDTVGSAHNACGPQEYLDLIPHGPYTPPRSRSNTMPSIRSRSGTMSAAAKKEQAFQTAYAWAAGIDPSSSSSADSLGKCKGPKKAKGKVRRGLSKFTNALGMSGRR